MKRIGAFWRSSVVAKLFILVGSLLFACFFCTVFMFLVPSPEREPAAVNEVAGGAAEVRSTSVPLLDEPEDSPTAEPTEHPTQLPTATLEPTATPEPTATSVPTDTPVPPTPTADSAAMTAEAANAQLTRTAAAEATTEAEVASTIAAELSAELTYRSKMVEISQFYVSALDGLQLQSEAAGNNPTLIINSDWINETKLYLVMMLLGGEEIRKLDPPAQFDAVHADMLKAADYFDLTVKYYEEGIDELSAAKLNLAAQNMQLGTQEIRRATQKLEAMAGP